MPKFPDGVSKFQKDVYPGAQALFEALSKGQSPEALLINCADSRIETSMITQTGPGDLFVCRNTGNITYPAIAARLTKGDMKIHGWVYDTKTGIVTAYDEALGTFRPLNNIDTGARAA